MQANGLVERYNQTIQNMIRKFIGEKKESWDIFLDMCTFAYNTSLQKSTNYTPFEVMFGRQAILPVDFDDGKHPNATAVLERLERMMVLSTRRQQRYSCRTEKMYLRG